MILSFHNALSPSCFSGRSKHFSTLNSNFYVTVYSLCHNLFSLSCQLDMALLHLANVLHRSHHSQDALVALRIALTSSSPSTSSSSSTSSVYLTMGNVLAVSSLTLTHLTHSLTRPPTHSLTHSLTHSPTHPPAHSLTLSPPFHLSPASEDDQ